MSKIVFKTIDNIVYVGDLEYLGKEDFIVKNLQYDDSVPKEQWIRRPESADEKYTDRVTFRMNKLIWYYQK